MREPETTPRGTEEAGPAGTPDASRRPEPRLHHPPPPPGFDPELAEARERFLERVEDVRPRLHRYCARLLGSALDGEDVVQEALARAWFKLPVFDGSRELEPWLFRIAHNRCVDWLRRVERRSLPIREEDIVTTRIPERSMARADSEAALRRLVLHLPPMERACVLLKEVLELRIPEIAEIVDSTVGGVKSALHRGRTKLRELREGDGPSDAHDRSDPDDEATLRLYVDRFNRRDWDGLEAVVGADARLEVPPLFDGTLENGPYFRNYQALQDQGFAWRFSLGRADGEPVLVRWTREDSGPWRPASLARLDVRGGRVVRIRDYFHLEYILHEAVLEVPEDLRP